MGGGGVGGLSHWVWGAGKGHGGVGDRCECVWDHVCIGDRCESVKVCWARLRAFRRYLRLEVQHVVHVQAEDARHALMVVGGGVRPWRGIDTNSV